jgi:hypothetical protein
MRFECKAEDLKKTAKSLCGFNKVDGVLIASWQLFKDTEKDNLLNILFSGTDRVFFKLNTVEIMAVKGISQEEAEVSIPFDVFIGLVDKVRDGDLILDISDEEMAIYEINN